MNPEQVVHYKIFLCAAGYEPEIRRITIDKDICHNYFYLKQKILAIFPTLKDVPFTISWKDQEGDNIRICTDDELVIALKEMAEYDLKKIYVNATPQGKEGPPHPDVVCDGCDNPVNGFRYKCIVCYDYDLCPDCERSQVHPDHPMIRIPLPLSTDMPFGRRFKRDISRMSKHLERLFQSVEHCGDKKAKGDYSTGNKCPQGEKKKNDNKYCQRNDLHNFIHSLLMKHVSKANNPTCGNPNASTNNKSEQEPPTSSQSEPQASTSSTDGFPIYEEQKNFVKILTNGLNSFLDPLGIDVIVEEDPVKEDSSQKRHEQHHSASGSSQGFAAGSMTTSSPSFSSAAGPAPASVSEASSTPTPLYPNLGTPQYHNTPSTSSGILSGIPALTSTIGVSALASTVGVPVPISTIGVPAPASTIGVAAPGSTLGVTASPSTNSVSAPVPIVRYSNIPAPTVTSSTSGVNCAISATGYANICNHQNPQEQMPVLDNTWMVVTNNGMGDSMMMIDNPQEPQVSMMMVDNPPEPTSPQVPQSVSSMHSEKPKSEGNEAHQNAPNHSIEETLLRMTQLGYKDEEWLRQLITDKGGSLQEVLRFLSPIPKPSLSTNINN